MTVAAQIKRTLNLDALVLQKGGHEENANMQMCVMEAVAYVAGHLLDGQEWHQFPERAR